MSSFFKILVGVLLIVAAIVGLLFSIAGLVGIWQVQDRIEAGLSETLTLLSDSLGATYQGLVVTQDSLQQSVVSINTLAQTVSAIGVTINTTSPLLDSVATLIGEELPASVESTRQSLISAQQGAAVMDSVLGVITAIPLISNERYNPDKPLSVSLGEVATNIEGLDEKFIEMSTKLGTTSESLMEVETGMMTMATDIAAIATTLEGFDEVMDQYKTTVNTVKTEIDQINDGSDQIVTMLVWAVTIFLAWMAIAQIAILTQGIEWVMRGKRKPNEFKEEIDVKEEPAETPAA
jgi:methyl-accepting chemotaxis protein